MSDTPMFSARQLLNQGKHVEAFEILKKCLENEKLPRENPQRDLCLLIGHCLARSGQLNEALQFIREELLLYPDNNLARQNFAEIAKACYPVNKERPQKKLTVEVISNILGKDNPIILDIGCHVGHEVKEFLHFMPRAEVYCFDPDPRIAKNFLFHQDGRVKFFSMAIGDEHGEVEFCQSSGHNPKFPHIKDWDFSSSLLKPGKDLATVHSWLDLSKTIKVVCQNLDYWVCNNLGPDTTIDLIWADVQGAERKLINGGINTLSRRTKLFFTEFGSGKEEYEGQPTLAEIVAMLPQMRCVGEDKYNALFVNDRYVSGKI